MEKKNAKATTKKEEKKIDKKVVKKEDKKPVKAEKKVEKKETKAEVANKTYHVSKRKEDGKWQVKFASGEKAIKLFATQVEAIEYAKKLANNQDGSLQIHKVDGKIRKQDYSKK